MLTSLQLEKMLGRRVVRASYNGCFTEYVIGSYRTMRIRVRTCGISDVHDFALSVEQIQAATN